MKKIIKSIIIVLTMLPFLVNAAVCTTADNVVNNYLSNPTYERTYRLYLVDNSSELLDKRIYDITKVDSNNDGSSYLFDGYNYCAKDGSNKVTIPVSNSEKAKVRIVETVKSETKVNGSGSYLNPWVFSPNYLLNISTNEYGDISLNNSAEKVRNITINTISDDINEIKLYPKDKYIYIGHNCGSSFRYDKSTNTIKVSNVKSNIKCEIYFGKESIQVNLKVNGDTTHNYLNQPSLEALYVVPNVGYYSDVAITKSVNKITIPQVEGYTFNGYTNKSGQKFIDKDGNILPNTTNYFTDKPSQAKILLTPIQYKIEYVLNGGTGSMSTTTCTYDTDCKLTNNSFTKIGYEFEEWNTKEDGTGNSYYDGASVKNLIATSNGTVKLYAKWTPYTATIKYNTNGAIYKGTNVNYSTNATTGRVLYKGNDLITTIKYGETIGSDGLVNPDNKSYLYLEKSDQIIKGHSEWCTKADGTGTCYDDTKNTYTASDFCNVDNGNCTIELFANWTSPGVFSFCYTNKFKVVSNVETKTLNSTCYSFTDSNWKVYFLNSGTLTVNNIDNNVDLFLVGGGGGGGTGYRGGGGGGGFVTSKNDITLSATTYDIVVGSGGGLKQNGGQSSISKLNISAGGGGAGTPAGGCVYGWDGYSQGTGCDTYPQGSGGTGCANGGGGGYEYNSSGNPNYYTWSVSGGGAGGSNNKCREFYEIDYDKAAPMYSEGGGGHGSPVGASGSGRNIDANGNGLANTGQGGNYTGVGGSGVVVMRESLYNTTTCGNNCSLAFSYTGNFKIESNGSVQKYATYGTTNTSWNKVYFLSSGILTVYKDINVDLFAVGGGGSGSGYNGKNGGGGGYTTTKNDNSLKAGKYTVIVGDGGVNGDGQASVIYKNGSSLITANGGKMNGSGGSSGGNYNDCYWAMNPDWSWSVSSSNGQAGSSNGGSGSKGQGRTTREFGESTGTLYSGGGGGSACGGNGGAGGAGGGGKGASGNAGPQPGQANTGGGGGGASSMGSAYGAAGGSGIVVIRNKR